jgi:2-polyprenyl-6-methoxyphenol hydroxylase-like FAD-dependent oxidoreductase
VGGREFGLSDHFQPSIPERLQKSRELFGQVPNHISQNRLLWQLYEHLPCKEKLQSGQDIKEILSEGDQYVLRNQDGKVVGRSEYVILCTGANSNLRDQLGIRMGGGREFYRLINIHFRSVKLG